RGKYVVSLDADLQNDPADIPAMMKKLEELGVDMVIGVRVNRHDTFSRRMQSKIGNGVRNWITRDQITDTGCSLKVVRRDAIDPGHWHWDLLALFGVIAQSLFAARFIIQWISSERRRESHIPIAFWYLSLTGGLLMTIYGVLRGDPVIVLGQAPGLVVYIRNLMLISKRAIK